MRRLICRLVGHNFRVDQPTFNTVRDGKDYAYPVPGTKPTIRCKRCGLKIYDGSEREAQAGH